MWVCASSARTDKTTEVHCHQRNQSLAQPAHSVGVVMQLVLVMGRAAWCVYSVRMQGVGICYNCTAAACSSVHAVVYMQWCTCSGVHAVGYMQYLLQSTHLTHSPCMYCRHGNARGFLVRWRCAWLPGDWQLLTQRCMYAAASVQWCMYAAASVQWCMYAAASVQPSARCHAIVLVAATAASGLVAWRALRS
jgi:hypothetical protein